ncbi:MAG: Clp protease N-terminal domain-containing protein [bacterium]|nr:Clp protease N-terminal domain-containing protein [bacterium]
MMNPLRDILINARQESIRMQHYFIGVEHLFIGLLELHNGLTGGLMEEQGLTPEYVIDAIRRATGKGMKARMWAGLPNTPRADIVLGIANDLAIEQGREEQIDERDVLRAILDENDSIPIRVLRRLHVDLAMLRRESDVRVPRYNGRQTYVQVDFAPTFSALDALSDDQLLILRRMFYGHDRIRIERKLMGGYSAARLLLITPTNAEGMHEAPVVAKIDAQDLILDEAQRYDLHVRASLPPLTARLEDKPTTAEGCDLAGLKYTFVAPLNGRDTEELRTTARELGAAALGTWLKSDLLAAFGATWWKQRRPFRFQVWSEYDYLLPPVLTLEYVKDDPSLEIRHSLRDPVRRAKLAEIEYGDLIAIEGFSVQRVFRDKHILHIANGKGMEAAKRAYKISVRGVDLAETTYFRGEVIERIVGRVWKNRDELLQAAASDLYPDFDARASTIPGVGDLSALPNPLIGYEILLDQWINGSMSKIHGDLHLGNILVGPRETPFLIDFAEARMGHVLFDWATLEVSILAEFIIPAFGANWDGIRAAARAVQSFNRGEIPHLPTQSQAEAFAPILSIRQIVAESLQMPDKWTEYFVALTLCAIRAITWETMTVGGRRLMLYIAALALHELSRRPRVEEQTPYDTDL